MECELLRKECEFANIDGYCTIDFCNEGLQD